ncbi:MAG: hypothetical protein P8M78_11715 [Myxococcota bacterium]|nr:hypothetical protein [Myxococcota bacterium]
MLWPLLLESLGGRVIMEIGRIAVPTQDMDKSSVRAVYIPYGERQSLHKNPNVLATTAGSRKKVDST